MAHASSTTATIRQRYAARNDHSNGAACCLRRFGEPGEGSAIVGRRSRLGGHMATQVTTTLIDDLDGSVAAETVLFTIGGSSYEIDLSAKNAAKLGKLLEPYKARRSNGRTSPQRARRGSKSTATGRSGAPKGKTLFSGLDAGQKDAFRTWASLPNARRISDERVQAWIDAGRPVSGKAPARKAPSKRAAPRKKATARKSAAAKR